MVFTENNVKGKTRERWHIRKNGIYLTKFNDETVLIEKLQAFHAVYWDNETNCWAYKRYVNACFDELFEKSVVSTNACLFMIREVLASHEWVEDRH